MAKAKLICVSVRPGTPSEARPWQGPAQIASMAGPGTQFMYGLVLHRLRPWQVLARSSSMAGHCSAAGMAIEHSAAQKH